jgi:hexosaminidase
MKYLFTGILVAATAMKVLAANPGAPAIIPAPEKMEVRDGAFKLMPTTRIYVNTGSRETGKILSEQLHISTGYPFKVSAKLFANKPVRDAILLTTRNASTNLGAEGYELTVASNSVVLRAPTQTGLFYGVQSLLQLLPPEIFSAQPAHGIVWQIPCVQIEDHPRFKWRGLMLDVSRHFFKKDEIKRLLDEMALHKLNTFHWHLVDDQGWRLEIKKYPKLTQAGAWRSGVGFGFKPDSTTAYGSDGRYGGFYTQEDVREIVAYAAARHITIVPEIEMPGHSVAALAAYPQFSCTGGPLTIALKGGVMHGIYCPGKDETFAFLQDVLAEVFQLFPSQYIHIGGDEVPKGVWKECERCQARIKAEGLKNEEGLQSYFVRRIEKFVNSRGRTLIGWSEILQGGLAQNAAVMDWIGGGLEAAREGHDVVMTPTEFCYFDYYQSRDQAAEPKAICCYLPLSKVYAFEPIPANLPADKQEHILGGQGNVWTEYIPNFRQVEYMAFPRLCALSEVVWSPKEARNWEDFLLRLRTDERRLDQLGVNYRHDSITTSETKPVK